MSDAKLSTTQIVLMVLLAIALALAVNATMSDPSPIVDDGGMQSTTVQHRSAIHEYNILNNSWNEEGRILDGVLYDDMQNMANAVMELTGKESDDDRQEVITAFDDATYEFLAATQMRRLHAIEFRSFLHTNKDELEWAGIDVDTRLRDMYYAVAACDFNIRLIRDGVRGEVPPDRSNFDSIEIYINE